MRIACPMLRRFDLQAVEAARERADATTGTRIEINRAMIASTARSSVSVNASARCSDLRRARTEDIRALLRSLWCTGYPNMPSTRDEGFSDVSADARGRAGKSRIDTSRPVH